jgi:hypothetical protein
MEENMVTKGMNRGRREKPQVGELKCNVDATYLKIRWVLAYA